MGWLFGRENGKMLKREPNKRFTFEFDEQGTNEVSDQIMNSYNSGFIDQDLVQSDNNDVQGVEG